MRHNSKQTPTKTNQYQPFPSSPSLLPVGFIEIILCPGIVSSVNADSKIPDIARFPNTWKESYPSSSPLQAAHSLDSRGLEPSPRSHQRVTTIACRKRDCAPASRCSVSLTSIRYSDGQSGQRRMGRQWLHKVVKALGSCTRRWAMSLTRCSRPCRPSVRRETGMCVSAHLAADIRSPSRQCAQAEK